MKHQEVNHIENLSNNIYVKGPATSMPLLLGCGFDNQLLSLRF